jgi:hypothetical protein
LSMRHSDTNMLLGPVRAEANPTSLHHPLSGLAGKVD